MVETILAAIRRGKELLAGAKLVKRYRSPHAFSREVVHEHLDTKKQYGAEVHLRNHELVQHVDVAISRLDGSKDIGIEIKRQNFVAVDLRRILPALREHGYSVVPDPIRFYAEFRTNPLKLLMPPATKVFYIYKSGRVAGSVTYSPKLRRNTRGWCELRLREQHAEPLVRLFFPRVPRHRLPRNV